MKPKAVQKTRASESRRWSARQASLFVVRRLRQGGHEALFAGGCVRDMLMGRRPDDYDVATSATPGDITRLFRRTLTVGAQFGVVVVMYQGQQVEVATFRTDGGYQDGRRPDSVEYTDARHDALRRDFTINGMFYDPIARAVIDFVGGQDDLGRRIIRAIGCPEDRFAEDHLRILRAVRFAARLNFAIEPLTWRAVCASAVQLQRISAERIMMELEKIILHANRNAGLKMVCDSGMLAVILPELSREQLERGLTVATFLPRRCDLAGALAALLADCPAKTVEIIWRRLKLSNEDRRKTRWLQESVRPLLESVPMTRGQMKRWLAQRDFADLLKLARAYLRGLGQSQQPVRILQRLIREVGDEPVAPERLLNGYDLLQLGCPAGKMVGCLDKALYMAQLENQVNDRDQAVKWARNWLAEKRRQ